MLIRVTHPYELALIGAHEDISLTVQLRLLGVLGLLLLRGDRGTALVAEERTTNSSGREQYQTHRCEKRFVDWLHRLIFAR